MIDGGGYSVEYCKNDLKTEYVGNGTGDYDF